MITGAIDIGGTSVKYGLVDVGPSGPRVLQEYSPEVLPDNSFQTLRAIVIKVAHRLLSDNPSGDSVGISTTGSVDRDEVVVSAGHFDGYVNVSWRDELTREFPAIRSVATTNDGRAAAWAEFNAVADQDRRSLIHAVVGTGVGGGIVYSGQLLLGDSGQSGYIGHIKVRQESPVLCSCGQRGCVESLSSSRAIAAAYSAAAGKSADVSFDDVVAHARDGEPLALQAFRDAAWWLGYGLGDAMNVVNPAVVTVGGGTALASDEVLNTACESYLSHVGEGMREAAHRRVFSSAELRLGQYGNDGGLIGAALLVS